MRIPEKIKLIRIPSYAPKFDLTQEVWQWIKDRVAVKLFKDVKTRQDKISELVKQLNPELVMSMTGYELYTKTPINKFKVK